MATTEAPKKVKKWVIGKLQPIEVDVNDSNNNNNNNDTTNNDNDDDFRSKVKRTSSAGQAVLPGSTTGSSSGGPSTQRRSSITSTSFTSPTKSVSAYAMQRSAPLSAPQSSKGTTAITPTITTTTTSVARSGLLSSSSSNFKLDGDQQQQQTKTKPSSSQHSELRKSEYNGDDDDDNNNEDHDEDGKKTKKKKKKKKSKEGDEDGKENKKKKKKKKKKKLGKDGKKDEGKVSKNDDNDDDDDDDDDDVDDENEEQVDDFNNAKEEERKPAAATKPSRTTSIAKPSSRWSIVTKGLVDATTLTSQRRISDMVDTNYVELQRKLDNIALKDHVIIDRCNEIERKINEINHLKNEEIESIASELERTKLEYDKQGWERYMKNLEVKEKVSDELVANQKIINELRTQNANVRTKNKELVDNILIMKNNIKRLQETNTASDNYLNQIKNHITKLTDDNNKLSTTEKAYVNAIDSFQNEYDKIYSYYMSEYTGRMIYTRLITAILTMVEGSSNTNATNDDDDDDDDDLLMELYELAEPVAKIILGDAPK